MGKYNKFSSLYLNWGYTETLKVFDDFKNKHEGIYVMLFLICKIYIFWKFIQYPLH